MREILIDMYKLYGNEPKSQELIAEQLGVSQPTISQWIKNLRLTPKTLLVPVEGGDNDEAYPFVT